MNRSAGGRFLRNFTGAFLTRPAVARRGLMDAASQEGIRRKFLVAPTLGAGTPTATPGLGTFTPFFGQQVKASSVGSDKVWV